MDLIQDKITGQFLKGTGGPGRPRGSRNKVTREIIENLLEVVAKLESTIDQDLEEIGAIGRVSLWRDLQEYLVPKLQRTSVDFNSDADQLNKIIFEVVQAPSHDKEPESK